jgi:hypothetical protein
LSRSTSRTLRIDNLSAGIGNPALLQGLLIRRFDRRRERRSGRFHRLSAIIGMLSGLRRNPVRNASDSAPLDVDHVRGVQGRYFVIALPVAAIFVAAVINRELPEGMPAAIAIAGSVIAGITTVEALRQAHWY